MTHANQTLFIVGVDPLTLGIIQSPGEYGADIVIGEGKALGNPMDFGGSTLGIFACRQDYIRQLPGRIIGMTKDQRRKHRLLHDIATREQHIRREKATSNICTNEGLCMLATAVHLAWLGGTGLTELGTQQPPRRPRPQESHHHHHRLHHTLQRHQLQRIRHPPPQRKNIHAALLHKGIHGGLLLEPWFPDLKDTMLFGVTELHTPDHIKRFLNALKEVASCTAAPAITNHSSETSKKDPPASPSLQSMSQKHSNANNPVRLPVLEELQLMRHYLHLSQMNYGVETGMYPFGSCTMKYNPKLCEAVSQWDSFTLTHPLSRYLNDARHAAAHA